MLMNYDYLCITIISRIIIYYDHHHHYYYYYLCYYNHAYDMSIVYYHNVSILHL